jgi:hypothetical protein
MVFLGPLRRFLAARRLAYKRVATGAGSRRPSDTPSADADDDSDPYMEEGELAHGPFVYSAFLMLGCRYGYTANMQDLRCFSVGVSLMRH